MGAGHAHPLYVHGHSRLHRMAPEAKLAAALVTVVAVAVTPRHAVWAFAVDGAVLAALVRAARVPGRFVLARLTVILPFVLFALTIPLVATGDEIRVAGLGLSRQGLWGTFNVIAKAGLGATVSILLAATTEVPHLLAGMERLRVPRTLTAIAAFMIRYLELVADELGRMRAAMTARGYDPRWLWQVRPLATAAGALFVRTFERGERIHEAMLSRGYVGVMPAPRARTAGPRDWLAAAPVAAAAVTTATLAHLGLP